MKCLKNTQTNILLSISFLVNYSFQFLFLNIAIKKLIHIYDIKSLQTNLEKVSEIQELLSKLNDNEMIK